MSAMDMGEFVDERRIVLVARVRIVELHHPFRRQLFRSEEWRCGPVARNSVPFVARQTRDVA